MNDLTPVVLAEVARVKNDLHGLDGDVSAGFSAVLARQHPTEYPWRVFTSSGSFVIPSDGDYYIIVVGGGGGGGGGGLGGMSGGHGGGGGGSGTGGGGGGVSIRQSVSLLAGSTLTVTVGAGGAEGSAGGTSSVSGAVSMSSSGGAAGSGGNAAPGGSASGGDINIPGGSGAIQQESYGAGGGGAGGGNGSAGVTTSAGAFAAAGGYGGGGCGMSGTGAGPSGQVWLDFIPGYKGPGAFPVRRGGPGIVAIRRVK